MFVEDLEQQHIDIAESIIQKITPDAALATDLIGKFRALVQDQHEDEDGFVSLLDSLAEACDPEVVYYVDWKDTDSFVDHVSKIAQRWGCQLNFPGRYPEQSVSDLIRVAHAELEASALGLWGWDTQGDCYSGWIGRLSDAFFLKKRPMFWTFKSAPLGQIFDAWLFGKCGLVSFRFGPTSALLSRVTPCTAALTSCRCESTRDCLRRTSAPGDQERVRLTGGQQTRGIAEPNPLSGRAVGAPRAALRRRRRGSPRPGRSRRAVVS